MAPTLKASLRHPFLLFLEDHGAWLVAPDGRPLGSLGDVAPGGAEAAGPRAEALRQLLPKGAPVHLCVGLTRLGIHCQETPAMPPKEARQVALRAVAAEQPEASMLVGETLDPDPQARGGHIHWTAFLPVEDLSGWSAALEAAGLKWIHASPWPRALWQGLPRGPEAPRDRVVLALAPRLGRLLFFRGAALVLQRTFQLPDDPTEEAALEQCAEETARTLQFYKQKFRGSVPGELLLLGAPSLPAPLEARFRSLGLAASCAQEPLETLLLRGLGLERGPQGLDLRPPHIREAHRRRTLLAALAVATASTLAAFTLGAALVGAQERRLESEALQAEAELARRKAEDVGRQRAVAARAPLLRLRAAEARQAQATERLGRLAAALLSPPDAVELEKVDIQQQPGEDGSLAFQVTGTALTHASFSVGPLAEYLARLQRLPGLSLDPVKEISISDRIAEGEPGIQSRALTRFTLSGRHR